jgi:pimeloyl-ACP methyl ester carboxylesterase
MLSLRVMEMSHLTVDGHRVAVEVRGEGPLVICSPAMGDTRDAYAPLADHLVAHGYRVALLDLRGHGDSGTGFSRYGDEATADDLLAAIDALADGTPVVLAGASMSAAAAVIAAGRRPEAVAGLVLLGPFLRNGPGGAAVRAGLRLMLARPWGPAVWRAYSARLWPGLGTTAARARAAAGTRLLTRPGRWAAFTATVAGADHAAVTPWLARVAVPTLVVMGEADPDWSDPRAEAAWAAEQLGGDVLMVPGAGHAPMLESPDVVAPRVRTFLDGALDAARRS